tara:strand:+ start:144 stop:698 length:555 start_codon:yes stop_codon:yes gene_type:complete
MSSKTKDVHIYIASASIEDSARFGFGWIKTDNKDKFITQKSCRVDKSNSTEKLANVQAVAHALSMLDKNATATIFTSSSDIANALTQPEVLSKNVKKRTKDKSLSRAWNALDHSLAEIEEVNVILTSPEDYPLLKEAEILAVNGAEKPFKKAGKDRRNFDKHTKNMILGDYQSSLSDDYTLEPL